MLKAQTAAAKSEKEVVVEQDEDIAPSVQAWFGVKRKATLTELYLVDQFEPQLLYLSLYLHHFLFWFICVARSCNRSIFLLCILPNMVRSHFRSGSFSITAVQINNKDCIQKIFNKYSSDRYRLG